MSVSCEGLGRRSPWAAVLRWCGISSAVVFLGACSRCVSVPGIAYDESVLRGASALIPLPATPDGGVLVLLAAGDIGDCGTSADTETGLLLDRLPGAIAVLGDIAYLRLTLRPSSYDWEFVPVAGQTFSDMGSANCH